MSQFVEDTGIDPVAYRMQSDRSTIWANPPVPIGREMKLFNCKINLRYLSN